MCDKHIELNGCELYVLNMIIHDTRHEVWFVLLHVAFIVLVA